MTSVPFYQVDAFAERTFGGNPAAVCVLESWPSDDLLAEIAAENNLSETAFLCDVDGRWELRWFTPTVEVSLCGHATLATAHVAYSELGEGATPIVFHSRSGPLRVTPLGSARYRMDFPAVVATPCEAPAVIAQALGCVPEEVFRADEDYLVRLPDAGSVGSLAPDLHRLGFIDARGFIVTAPGDGTDFCSRFFGPAVGVPEDPVTGSAHCALGPYWSARLGRDRLTAEQLSARGGILGVETRGDRVLIEGSCVTVIVGEFRLP